MNDLIVKYNGALVTTQNKISKLTNNNENFYSKAN